MAITGSSILSMRKHSVWMSCHKSHDHVKNVWTICHKFLLMLILFLTYCTVFEIKPRLFATGLIFSNNVNKW